MAHEHIEVFVDDDSEYRFRVVAANGEIVAGSEGYTRKADCLERVRTLFPNMPVDDLV